MEAARLLGASDAARAQMGCLRPPLRAGDHDALVAAGRSVLSDAFDHARSEGLQLALDDAVAYASRARGPRQRPASGWASLTPTEQQVVAHVTRGLSNPEIAAQLFITRATVKTHLSHIYAKLGVANRAELAALATRETRNGSS